jgi:ribosomal protein S27AE
MKGGIYSDGKCPVCSGSFVDNHLNALACSKHPKCRATSFKVKFGEVTKRFRSYEDANRFLNGVRFKTDERTFDPRDYKRDNPLSFINMSTKWLEYKKTEIRKHSYRSISNHIDKAQAYFNHMNVKDIRYGNFEDFIRGLELADKTRHNILATLHSFFVWLKRRHEINDLPEFPVLSYDLGYRRTVDKQTQVAILEEIRRIAPEEKTYIGIMLLTTYFSIRPNEMRLLKEGNIDTGNGYIYIPSDQSKTEYKAIPLINEDIDLFKSFQMSPFPETPFFRHDDGRIFGVNHFYRYWKKACKNLRIEDVDLYGGTKHSSARALRRIHSPEEIQRAMMTKSNKAFERYYKIESEDARMVYQSNRENVVPFKKTEGQN